jgi:hypothetical protein
MIAPTSEQKPGSWPTVVKWLTALVEERGVHKNSAYWGVLFPPEIYTASTFQLAKALGLDFLLAISHLFIAITLLA